MDNFTIKTYSYEVKHEEIIGAKIIGELRERMDKEAADKKCSAV